MLDLYESRLVYQFLNIYILFSSIEMLKSGFK